VTYVYRWTNNITGQHYTGCHICACKGRTCGYRPKVLRHIPIATLHREWTQEFLVWSNDKDFLFNYEREVIGANHIGGSAYDGLSLNKSTGGCFSQATAQDKHIRDKQRAIKATPEHRAKLTAVMNSVEVRRKTLAAQRSPEYREKQRDSSLELQAQRMITMRSPSKVDYQVVVTDVMEELNKGARINCQLNLCHDATSTFVTCRGMTATQLLLSGNGWRLGRPKHYRKVTVSEAR